MQDFAEENPGPDLFKNILKGQELAPDVESVDPSYQEYLLELRYFLLLRSASEAALGHRGARRSRVQGLSEHVGSGGGRNRLLLLLRKLRPRLLLLYGERLPRLRASAASCNFLLIMEGHVVLEIVAWDVVLPLLTHPVDITAAASRMIGHYISFVHRSLLRAHPVSRRVGLWLVASLGIPP